MSDRTARLEELREITGGGSIAELEKRRELDLRFKSLTSVPLGVCDLTGLVKLWLNVNQFSSLPPEISRLTRLEWLNVRSNPIEELPPQITALTRLRYLWINAGYGQKIKRAPRGITNLPCWNSTGCSDNKHIRGLQLYDPADTAAEARKKRKAEEAPMREETRKGANNFTDPNSAPVTGDYADVMTAKFSPEAILGQGGFGTAYKVQLQKGIVAVKVLKKKAKPGTAEYDELTKEPKMMINLRHKNIIGLYAYGCRNQEIMYVMEYADGKSVWDVIEATGALSLDKSILYSIHINAGLKYLHSQSPPVGHRDLKPENVLICKRVAKICDFGTSSAREAVSCSTGFQGTFHYAAPEHFSERSYGPLSDIYTFALVIWAMLAGKRPYDGLNPGQIMNQKMQQKLPVIPPTTLAKLAALMNDCWNTEARNRPSAEAIEPRLTYIQMNPEPAVGEKGKSVKDMNTAELVAYLEKEKALPTFVATVKDKNRLTGSRLFALTKEDLTSAPYRLNEEQAENIMDLIDEAKRT